MPLIHTKVKQDVKNESNVLRDISLTLVGEETQNHIVLANLLSKREEYFQSLNFNYEPILAKSKKFNMQMTKFDGEIIRIFGLKCPDFQFSGVKFLQQIEAITLFRFEQDEESSTSESDDEALRRLQMRRAAMSEESFAPAQDNILSEMARLIDPETDVLCEYHQEMLSDVLFAVQQIDVKATAISSLFQFEDDFEEDIEDGRSAPLAIQPGKALRGVLRSIHKSCCGLPLEDKEQYARSDFSRVLYLLRKFRQMLEIALELWPFRYSFSFLFAKALETDLFYCDDWGLKRKASLSRNAELNWYMNSLRNFMFPGFNVAFSGFEQFIAFFHDTLSGIPSNEFALAVEAKQSGFTVGDILARTRRQLAVRNQLNQVIDFGRLEKFIGPELYEDFREMIRVQFTEHIQQKYIEFPFSFLYKLGSRIFQHHIDLAKRFPSIKQREVLSFRAPEGQKVVTKQEPVAYNDVQRTIFSSSEKKTSTVLATVLFLQLFYSYNFSNASREFKSINDFCLLMKSYISQDFSGKLIRNYSIQPFIVLDLSEGAFFHYQEFFKPNSVVLTRTMLNNVFKGAKYASEQQNIEVLIELNYEQTKQEKTMVSGIISLVFQLREQQIESPIFFLYYLFVKLQEKEIKLQYLLSQNQVLQRSRIMEERPRSLQFSLRKQLDTSGVENFSIALISQKELAIDDL